MIRSLLALLALSLAASTCCSKAKKTYVELADWCRPGMTEKISAQDWAKANNAFGLKLLRTTEGNTVFSPYSIERALGMALEGACGETANEMLKALEMPNARELGMSGLAVEEALKAVNQKTSLEIENTLWPDVSLKLPDDYLARIAAAYRNKVTQLDYPADPEKARTTINDAVAKATHDRIQELIPKKSITELTRLVLTNSVYFKSEWIDIFEKEKTKEEDFYTAAQKIKIPMMHRVDVYRRVCVAKDYAIYDLPFHSSDRYDAGNELFRIILPTIDPSHPMEDRMKQLEAVEKQLTAEPNCKYKDYDVNLSLPKFKLQPDSISILPKLEQLGMKRAFTDQAEFYAMPNETPKPSDPSSYLKISDVLHKAFIEIDEQGGEAAAATAVVDSLEEAAPEMPKLETYDFRVDHPFLFMIIENSTGAALFMGRVTDPTL